MKPPAIGAAAVELKSCEGEQKTINPELWHACAGPLVALPPVGSLVVYFPQGHSEQVAASMQKGVDGHVPNYPNLPSKLICLLHNVTLHADAETDEVYAQMTLQPVNTFDEKALLASDLALRPNKPQTDFFCKTLTASDTSTHGGFSVPRRAAEKIFPALDFSTQPPAQELQARDLHDSVWTFRHIYRGQPKRHLLTTGWSLFVSGKRLFAGDSVLFIRDEKQQLLLGIRRANKQPTNISSSVLSSDSMHIGVLAAAAHAAANKSPFTIFYNPRASPSEFVVPLAKYQKALYSNQLSLGMRFRMMFETEDSGTRRYMGTITGISDLDPVRWKNSQWRNLQVGWDESAAGEKRNRVSIWEIEPVAAPFFMCPPPYFGSKRPRQPGMPEDEASEMENLFKRAMPWLGEEICIKDSHSQNGVMPGLSLVQWMNMQHNPSLANSGVQSDYMRLNAVDLSRQLGLQAQLLQQENPNFSAPRLPQQTQQAEQIQKLPILSSQLGSVNRSQQQIQDMAVHQRQHLANQAIPLNQNQAALMQPQVLVQTQAQQQQAIMQNHQHLQTNIQNNHLQHQQIQQKQQQQQQYQVSDHQIQVQLLRKLQQQQQQQQSILSQSTQPPPHLPQAQEQQRTILEAPQHLSYPNPNPNPNPLPQQQQVFPQQCTKAPLSDARLPHPSQQQLQQKFQQQQVLLSDLPPGGSQSAVTDNIPSCSTSPSTNNSVILPQPMINRSSQKMPGSFECLVENPNVFKEFTKHEHNVRHSTPIPTVQSQVVVNPQTYLINTNRLDYLDTSSSATSACLQNDGTLQQSLPFSSFDQPPMFRDAPPHIELQGTDPRSNVLFGVNIEDQLGIPIGTNPLLANTVDTGKYQNHISANVVADCSNSKDAQQELSSSIVSQSFGVPDMAFNSIDSAIDENGFLNKSSWTPAPQLQRMRTYTKVYKRGAVGRSIDVTRYAGYNELKHDLARMFSIEGQLEYRQRVGWKLVYVDHENDVLLVGDDPWEEFVSCVRCIRILSHQEVQQMSLDADLVNNLPPNQACSSSDGNAWRAQGDQNSGNPSAGSYDRIE